MTQRDETEPLAWEEASERLEVVLRTPLFLTGQPAPLVGVAIAPHVFAYATVNGLLLPAAEAVRWSKSFTEILARAVTHLEKRPPRLVREGQLARLESADGCVASRILLPGFFDAFANALGEETFSGGAICAIPDGSTCLLAPAGDDEALVRMYEAAFTAWHESDAPLSPVVYEATADAETFAPVALAPDHPAMPLARRAAALLLASVYAEQKASLEGVDEAPLLAPFEIAPHDELGVVTCAIAIRGVDALLPETDLVMLREGPEDDGRLVPRQDLERGRLLFRVADFDPPRLGLVRFP